MTYRGVLPTGQSGFPGQQPGQQDHRQMYGGQLGFPQANFQQRQQMPNDQRIAYSNGAVDPYYGQHQLRQGHDAQQQNQYAARQQQELMRMQMARQQQQQQQQRPSSHFMGGSVSAGNGIQPHAYDQYAQPQHAHPPQQAHAHQQQPLWQQQGQPHSISTPQQQYYGHTSPRQSFMGQQLQQSQSQHALHAQQSSQQQISDQMLHRMYHHQQVAPQHMRSPQIHQQPSPQPSASPLLPSQMQRNHSLQSQGSQQTMPSPIQQQLHRQFHSPTPPHMHHQTSHSQMHSPQSQPQSQHFPQYRPTPPPPAPAPAPIAQQMPHEPPQAHGTQHDSFHSEPDHRTEPDEEPEKEPEKEPEEEPEEEPDEEPDEESEPEPEPEPVIEVVTEQSRDTGLELLMPEPSHPSPIQEPVNFVNPLDIFNAPPPQSLPPLPLGDLSNLGRGSKEAELGPKTEISSADPSALTIGTKLSHPDESWDLNGAASQEIKKEVKKEIKKEYKREERKASKPELKQELKPDFKPEPARIKSSPHSSVTNSPALSTKSSGIVKRSPAAKARLLNTVPVMAAIAEECLGRARSSVHDVAMSLDAELVDEYQGLIATSLSCLEAAMSTSKLAPREEARLRMRYAAVLQEETENLMEAELALGKGITLCDKHRIADLKYCMQYLMLKVLFQRNHKAALKAVDGHISDCEAFKHVQWYYAFRLLKSTFYMAMGTASDGPALENVRAVQNLANARGDKAMTVLASILEGLALLKTSKDGNIERVNSCIAQAAKFQFDPGVKNMQLDLLMLMLDFGASLFHQSPDTTSQKLRLLQQRLDECEDWNNIKADFEIPVKKQYSTAKTVSEATATIIRPGAADGESDYVVMTFMTKVELRSLVFMLSGLANLHKPSTQGRRSTEFWLEGVKILDTWDASTAGIPYGPSVSLSMAIRQRTWRTDAQAYLCVLLGLLAASHCQWSKVNELLSRLDTLITPTTQPTIELLSLYLRGVHSQGTGNLGRALGIFLGPRFDIPPSSSGVRAGQREIALLAGLNRLWIMQHPSCRNDEQTQDLIEQLQPFCTNHWNIDLRTAWHNVVAALETDPPQQLNQQKQHIQAAMSGSKVTSNIIGAAVTLCIMRSRFFENIIGEQALKSARAASKQAQRSGNLLWQSVADGMLAQSYEVQGRRDESSQEWEKATKEARDAFAGSW